MVELTLEHVQENGMPPDCFVSVRVGNAQKLSRLSAARVFSFPGAADRRFGRVEVFRRIGSCSIDVDPTRGGLREINVDCAEAGFGSLGLKLAIAGEPGAPAPRVPGAKEKCAKDYLTKHGIEEQLSSAMQEVLRERPEKPLEFLAANLLSRRPSGSGGTMKLPPMSGSAEWHKPAKHTPATRLESLGKGSTPSLQAQPRDLFSAPPPAQGVTKPTVAVVPSGTEASGQLAIPRTDSELSAEYYRASFGAMGPEAYAKRHSAMPKTTVKKDPQTIAPSAIHKTDSERSAEYYRATFGAMGSEGYAKRHSAMPKTTGTVIANPQTTAPTANVLSGGAFNAYHVVNFRGGSEATFENLFNSFPRPVRSKFKASVGTWMMPLPRDDLKQRSSKLLAAKFKPSVGTWMMPLLDEQMSPMDVWAYGGVDVEEVEDVCFNQIWARLSNQDDSA